MRRERRAAFELPALTRKGHNMTGHLDKEQLNSMTKDELIELAAEMDLDTSGRKADLVKRIAAAEVEVQDEDELTDEDKKAIEEAKAEDAAAADHDEPTEAVEEAAPVDEPKQAAKKPVIEAGGKVLVTCSWDYYDNALNSVVHVGDQLRVSDERAKHLKSLGLVK